MIVELQRLYHSELSTQGLLSINGVSKFNTLEPPSQSGMLIQVGTYHCVKNMSPRLGYVCPEILNVPGHTGERIHIGNFPDDTIGCVLIGLYRFPDEVTQSETAFHQFMAIVPSEFDMTISEQANES